MSEISFWARELVSSNNETCRRPLIMLILSYQSICQTLREEEEEKNEKDPIASSEHILPHPCLTEDSLISIFAEETWLSIIVVEEGLSRFLFPFWELDSGKTINFVVLPMPTNFLMLNLDSLPTVFQLKLCGIVIYSLVRYMKVKYVVQKVL